ncbi:MAG: anti-sigma factor family protein [Armatimonadota bacterium]
MRCDQAQQWINLWLDERLATDQQAQLQQHLDACPHCRQLAERWLCAREVLRSYPTITPATDFDVRVWQTITQRQQSAWTLSPALRIASSAVVGVFVAITLITTMWLNTPRERKPLPVFWLGGREAMEWAQLLLGTEGGKGKWQDDSSSRSFLPFCLWWRS